MSVTLSPVCLVCETALSGVLGVFSRFGGVKRSSENPNLCNRCDSHIGDGRIVELAVFFADLTGYTGMTHDLGPERTHEILDRYLNTAREVVVRHDGFVSQFVGDEVMAFFNVPIQREDFSSKAVDAAYELKRQVNLLGAQLAHPLQATIGIAVGHARVGRVGAKEIAHYSAIGDVVNRAARLVSHVEPGGILVDETVFAAIAARYPDAKTETVELKGFDEPVPVSWLSGDPCAPEVDLKSAEGAKKLRIATTFAAIFSAPCAGYVALNGISLALGFGALGFGAVGSFLDQAFVRIPMLVAAAAGALALLYTAREALPFIGTQPEGLAARPTLLERWRTRSAIGLAVAALVFVTAELFAHAAIH
ncbi:MAG: adenylate/guanylate cyclase domain-containing protein [Pseudomonadota bacterium]